MGGKYINKEYLQIKKPLKSTNRCFAVSARHSLVFSILLIQLRLELTRNYFSVNCQNSIELEKEKMNCINRISFKLKSAKYLFCIGVIITLVITSFATSKDSDDFQQKIQVTSELITGEL